MRFSRSLLAFVALLLACACSGGINPTPSTRSLVSQAAAAGASTVAEAAQGAGLEGADVAAKAGATPSCAGVDAKVRASHKPHGLYVWNPNHFGPYVETSLLKVIGRDRSLCGASFVINWRDVNPARGVYDWSYVDGSTPPSNAPTPAPSATPKPVNIAAPYVAANLRVNLLFADGPEIGSANDVTPDFVTDPASSGGDGVPVIQCAGLPNKPGLPDQPYYPDAKFEADWAAFIKAAVAHFSSASPIAANIGYMRFGQGFGTEAEPGHGYDGSKGGGDWSAQQPACENAWTNPSLSPPLSVATWKTHSLHVVDAIATAATAAATSKQMMIALNGYSGDAVQDIGAYFGYELPNAVSAAAAADGIGFGTENLGDTNPPTEPCGATGSFTDLYWCAPVNAPYAHAVPIEFQTITQTAPHGALNVTTILKYAIANHAQILELYPAEWLRANGIAPSKTEPVPSHATRAAYECALYSAGTTLGLAPSSATATPPPCSS